MSPKVSPSSSPLSARILQSILPFCIGILFTTTSTSASPQAYCQVLAPSAQPTLIPPYGCGSIAAPATEHHEDELMVWSRQQRSHFISSCGPRINEGDGDLEGACGDIVETIFERHAQAFSGHVLAESSIAVLKFGIVSWKRYIETDMILVCGTENGWGVGGL